MNIFDVCNQEKRPVICYTYLRNDVILLFQKYSILNMPYLKYFRVCKSFSVNIVSADSYCQPSELLL